MWQLRMAQAVLWPQPQMSSTGLLVEDAAAQAAAVGEIDLVMMGADGIGSRRGEMDCVNWQPQVTAQTGLL